MKVSLNWIKDYVDLPQDFDLKKLAYDLTMTTVEVEGVEDLAERFDKIIVGKIVEILPHPNADKLRICRTRSAMKVPIRSLPFRVSRRGMSITQISVPISRVRMRHCRCISS